MVADMVDTSRLFDIALHGIALVIGVAVVVTIAFEALDVESAVSLLGVGLAALALSTISESGTP